MKNFKITNVLTMVAMVFTLMVTQNSCTDPCKDVTCLNAGTCNEGTCECATGYEGDDCGTAVRAKFLGSYSFTETCSPSGADSYTVIVTESSSVITDIKIGNIYNKGLTVTASISGTTLTIPSQSFGTATISGSGTISGSTLNLTFTVTGATTDSCSGSGTK